MSECATVGRYAEQIHTNGGEVAVMCTCGARWCEAMNRCSFMGQFDVDGLHRKVNNELEVEAVWGVPRARTHVTQEPDRGPYRAESPVWPHQFDLNPQTIRILNEWNTNV